MVQHFERGRLHAYDDGLAFACRNRTWSLPWNHSSLYKSVISEMQAEVKLRGFPPAATGAAIEIAAAQCKETARFRRLLSQVSPADYSALPTEMRDWGAQ